MRLKNVWKLKVICYVNKLHGGLSALHIERLSGVAPLDQLAGDGVQGARPLVQLLYGVELKRLRGVVDKKSVGLNMTSQ